MSSRFSIGSYAPVGEANTIKDLTPEDMLHIGIKMVHIASYFLDHEELVEEAKKQTETYKIGLGL